MQPDWEIWLDCHISPVIAKWLMDDNTEWKIKSSYSLKLYGFSDFEIYAKAKAAGNIIIVSKDSDLAEIISVNGSPPKLINLKMGNCDNKILFILLKQNLEKAIRLLNDFKKDIIEIN